MASLLKLRFLLDVDNLSRYRLDFDSIGAIDHIMECCRAFNRDGEMVNFDIKDLGVLEIAAVQMSPKDSTVIIKTNLIFDYRNGGS